MSDFDKIIHFASAARGTYDTFSEAVGEEGEVVRDGRKISYKATGGFYRWELYYTVVATDEETGFEEKAEGRNKEKTIEEAISLVLTKVTDCSSDTNPSQGTCEPAGSSSSGTAKATKSRPQKKCNLDRLIDVGSKALKHLGRIADSMSVWEGKIAEELDLAPADVEAIKRKHPNELKLQARAALIQWKQTKGCDATYKNLIRVFEVAGYRDYADAVRSIFTGEFGSGSTSEPKQPSPSPSTSQKGLIFSEDMSDRDFKAYLQSKGVRERDFSSLDDNGIVAKVFLELTEDDIENPQFNISFGGKKILKKLLKQLKK